MKRAEEMIRAVKDWAKDLVQVKISSFQEELDLETILRKTGDASKVTNVFSNASSRTLPTSGESLDITLGKIRRYLSDLSSGMAFSKDADYLTWKQIIRCYYLKHASTSAAFEETIANMFTSAEHNYDPSDWPQCLYLLYGTGGAVSTSGVQSDADFFRVYFLARPQGNVKAIQAASVGSTTRFTLVTTLPVPISIKIPKGSYANVRIMRLPFAANYVNT